MSVVKFKRFRREVNGKNGKKSVIDVGWMIGIWRFRLRFNKQDAYSAFVIELVKVNKWYYD